MDTISYKNYTTEQFLQAISYKGELYSLLDGRYVFRGHASENWELVPSALRKDAFENLFYDDEHRITSVRKDSAPDWECLQIDREISVLRNFYEKCDKAGLQIPEIERLRQSMYSALPSSVTNEYENWLSEDFLANVNFRIPA